MRLKRLWIQRFRNLENFEITFEADSPYSVLVGQNGSGKSNLFEALLKIFDHLERRQYPPFAYSLSYHCRGNLVEIDSNPAKKRFRTVVHLTPAGSPQERKRQHLESLYSDPTTPGQRFLPEFVFGYYSGFCDRFQSPFVSYRQSYTEQLKQAQPGAAVPRRLLYGDLSFADLILLSLWAHKPAEEEPKGLLKTLGLKQVAGARIHLQPSARFNQSEDEPRSLGLRGVMKDFVAEIDLALNERDSRSSGEGKDLRKECVFSEEGLQRLASFASARSTNLFNMLLQLREEGVLRGVSCSLVLGEGTTIPSDALSEGEKQLLLVMGILRFAEHSEALFLLDEPDTHLNPLWSLQYLKLAEEELGHKPAGHIVLATHDPLMFAGLTRNEVRILSREATGNSVSIAVPQRDPKGMGVPAILMSDVFGLRSVLDLKTQELLDEKRQLAVKDNRNDEETKRLKDLNILLREVDVSQMVSDPLYPIFVKRVVRHPKYDQLRRAFLDAEQKEALEKIADDVLKELEAPDAVH